MRAPSPPSRAGSGRRARWRRTHLPDSRSSRHCLTNVIVYGFLTAPAGSERLEVDHLCEARGWPLTGGRAVRRHGRNYIAGLTGCRPWATPSTVSSASSSPTEPVERSPLRKAVRWRRDAGRPPVTVTLEQGTEARLS